MSQRREHKKRKQIQQIIKWQSNPIQFIEDMGIELKWYQKLMLKYLR